RMSCALRRPHRSARSAVAVAKVARERKEEVVMRNDADDRFLCEMPGKCKRFTFYSGVMKGGTTHELLSCTITFFERWSDLTMHEIRVCRECQVRLWKQKFTLPLVAFAAGAGLALLVALVGLLLPWPALLAGVAVGGIGALAFGGLFAFQLQQSKNAKPKHAQ